TLPNGNKSFVSCEERRSDKRPMHFMIGDRAALVRDFDIAELAIGTAKDWLRQKLMKIDPDRHCAYQVELTD
ncbi:MAG TPA: hypothetical protein VFS81_27710, partial [Candidatus Binatia bacterium]|nr:hypothetical protein [Candidatus Binatia bacterium]